MPAVLSSKPLSEPAAARVQRGIQSVEVGGALLVALAHEGRPMPLKDLARAAGMSAAKAHPYLVSFGKLGLVEQDVQSGRYGLGRLALQLGLIGLQQVDPVRVASRRLPEIARETGHTVAIALWSERGATIVMVEASPALVHVSMRHGTVMSVRGTATGRLFAAHLSRAQVLPALRAEGVRGIDAALRRELDAVRAQGIACAVDAAVPGISALAAPVFEAAGRLVLSLTAIGPNAVFDARPEGALARALRAHAQTLSQELGAAG